VSGGRGLNAEDEEGRGRQPREDGHARILGTPWLYWAV
jgi:hypothetical protein